MDQITFIDPKTGAYYEVKPAKATVDFALKLGYLPYTAADDDAVDKVLYDR